MQGLTETELALHELAVSASKTHKDSEFRVIESIQKVDQSQFFKKINCSSLNAYVQTHLGYSEAVTGSLISVSRKSKRIPRLQSALKNQEITSSVAQKFLSVVTNENAEELIEFTKHNSCRALERKVSGISGNQKVTITIDQETLDLLERVRALECQSEQSSVTRLSALKASLKLYIERKDPILKAKRALKKSKNSSREVQKHPREMKKQIPEGQKQTRQAKKQTPEGQKQKTKRTPPPAYVRHLVNLRDERRCTHINSEGKRCVENKWLDLHHVTHVKDGGTNDPDNLRTLCGYHHDLEHQLSFQFEELPLNPSSGQHGPERFPAGDIRVDS
jgi:hypothetical protein